MSTNSWWSPMDSWCLKPLLQIISSVLAYDFRLLNRRRLTECPDPNPYLQINFSTNSQGLSDEEFAVSGILHPSDSDRVGMISPSHSNVSSCPLNRFMYLQTGDTADLPLLCHYPVKMRVTWVSGDNSPQHVQYGGGKSATSQVSTFSQDNMCSSKVASPAKDFGWHDPGFHTAVMTGLKPSTTFSCKYGRTPPAEGSDGVRFLTYGDMGKAPRDASVENYIQPGSISVVKGMADEVAAGNVDSIFHIGDISYATGFLVEWDYFLHLISPVASKVSYMTAIGNHERSVHFTIISTEHGWSENSEQYEWMRKDKASVDRSKTPWLILLGHRPMYSSSSAGSIDSKFANAVEPLLLSNKVED
ncbi:Calcineurin-like phosphoesterase domain, ApaH type [Dillenia turbinata]|uniref:Purple acid phosphatase n=1 Tax=Dillenia turbinata TaxID=194707 RepID=A0AAN8VK37_9MAGN